MIHKSSNTSKSNEACHLRGINICIWLNDFHAAHECRRQVKNVTNFVKNVKMNYGITLIRLRNNVTVFGTAMRNAFK